MINTWPGWNCIKLLGKGSFGAVYEIQKEEFGKVYNAALKVISIPFDEQEVKNVRSMGLDDKSITDYFYSSVLSVVEECKMMHELKGITNIVSYEDHLVVPRQESFGWDILIRMELLTPLEDYIKDSTVTKNDIIRLGIDICRALEVCEKNKILHRDIKPANIFVNKFGDFKLGDFGIARTMEKTTGNLSQKGTFNYMAPEIYKGDAYDQTVDIYSLGIVLYRLLNQNRLPFIPEGKLTVDTMNSAQIKRMGGQKIEIPKNAQDALGKIVLKSIEYNPRDRYQSATEFKHALEDYLRNPNQYIEESETQILEEPKMTPPLKVVPPVRQEEKVNTPQPKQKNPVLYVVIALCIGAALSIGFVLFNLVNHVSSDKEDTQEVHEAFMDDFMLMDTLPANTSNENIENFYKDHFDECNDDGFYTYTTTYEGVPTTYETKINENGSLVVYTYIVAENDSDYKKAKESVNNFFASYQNNPYGIELDENETCYESETDFFLVFDLEEDHAIEIYRTVMK